MEGLWIVPAIAGSLAWALTAKWFFQSPVAEAMAERIRLNGRRRKHWKGLGGEWHDEPLDADGLDEGKRADLDDRLTALSDQVSELAERLDFAERLLADKREQRLPARG
ncbi:MAG TPA: hypothetical protein VJ816_12410 [Gemmatimonadales bacterium]|nr:hypothetical protein [Gemmatimonadales bacterium]